jgi:hypothetical protein
MAEVVVVLVIAFIVAVFFSGCEYENPVVAHEIVVTVDNTTTTSPEGDSGGIIDAGLVEVTDTGLPVDLDGGINIDAGSCLVLTILEIDNIKGSIPYINDILHFNHGDGVIKNIIPLMKCHNKYVLVIEADVCCDIRPGVVTWDSGSGVLKELHKKFLQDCK